MSNQFAIPDEFYIVVAQYDCDEKGIITTPDTVPRGPLVFEGYLLNKEDAVERAGKISPKYGWRRVIRVTPNTMIEEEDMLSREKTIIEFAKLLQQLHEKSGNAPLTMLQAIRAACSRLKTNQSQAAMEVMADDWKIEEEQKYGCPV